MLNHSYNRLLAALPERDRTRIMAQTDLVLLRAGTVLYATRQTLRYAYFPIDCILTLGQNNEGTYTGEVAVIGNEGFLGVAMFMGGRLATSTARALTGGHCLRLKGGAFKREVRQSLTFERLLLRYTQGLFFQSAQSGICRHAHDLRARTATCILSCLERLGVHSSELTMDLVARILEVKPADLGAAMRFLQAHRIVNCRGGEVEVTDRNALEQTACECYEIIKHEFQVLLPDAIHRRPHPIVESEACQPG
ncbi:Crp/Fnr family transcriptional regulator [Nevskia soli]|uniref:Crp/Fnr family transcriptional regulator n=1 Tax=Nevskia soli TaxID=418856 RepID=UPI0004A779F8|nr:Crp/Fnr family transcriptional regulator [Nevskia soli]